MRIRLKEKALTWMKGLRLSFWRGFAADWICGKAEDGRG
jgi:hypothetical protein